MDSLSSEAGSQRASSTAVPAKQPASMQSAFTMGSGAAPISPSKKRTHKDLKMRQTAASSPSTQPAKANPFAPYGVNSTSSQPSRNPAQRSPGKAPPGLSPTRRPKVTVKGPKGAQSMHVDSGLPSPATAPFLGASSRAAASNTDHLSSHQPAVAQPANAFPFHADIASTGTGFPQIGVPASHVPPSQANPLPNGHATASFTYKPAVAGASTHPTVSSVSPGSPNVGVKTNASSASAAAAAAAASPAAAVTPPSFRFGSSHHSRADTSSPQVPFQGFGAAGTAQNKTPTASFAGFQTGVQSLYCTVVLYCIVVLHCCPMHCLPRNVQVSLVSGAQRLGRCRCLHCLTCSCRIWVRTQTMLKTRMPLKAYTVWGCSVS